VAVLRPFGKTSFVLALAGILAAGLCSTALSVEQREIDNLRTAITDLSETFGRGYPGGPGYLARLEELQKRLGHGDAAAARPFVELKREALLANPLLGFDRLLVVKRRCNNPKDPGFPTNHECNSSLKRTGWDNEIAALSPVAPDGKLTTLYRPDGGGYVGEVELDFDAKNLLFTRSDRESWKIWEIGADGNGLRQVSRAPGDVDCFDPCRLPDGRTVFGSTASVQAVPCWHGLKLVSNLYLMNDDGTGVRQLCFDQDHNFHPVVLGNGQVLFHRWDYTGISHIFLRQLMVMNPDGTGQRAVYGTNSWYPNSLYFPRPLPDSSTRLVTILSGYHGLSRMGQLVLVDTSRGWYEADGLVLRISGRGDPIQPKIADNLVDDDRPLFLHPYPLSDKHFLVSCWPGGNEPWGLYLADVFDNLVLIYQEPGHAILEPVPLKPRKRPPAIPDRVELDREDAVVYLHDVHVGPGLRGVPRGTVKSLRLLAYHFGYPGLAGPDKIGRGGPWEVMRILGTVPLEEDGSASFRVPANTPLAVQALDAEGKAVQLMRSWFTAMPGEKLSCVGCHEEPADSGHVLPAAAALRRPREITPWRGPPRGFDFAREVQPVLDRYCVSCHNGPDGDKPDLRPEEQVAGYHGLRPSDHGVDRMHPQMKRDTRGMVKYTPAYEALLPYLRRVSIEDDVSLLLPGEYHADTSPLVQILRKGHGDVKLDAEAWDRLVTWIDLNAPCHGTWGEVYPIPDGAHERRMALRRQYGGPTDDPELVPETQGSTRPRPVKTRPPSSMGPRPVENQRQATAGSSQESVTRPRPVESQPVASQHGPGAHATSMLPARSMVSVVADGAERELSVDLGEGVTMRLVRIAAGEFVMGFDEGEPDERPTGRVVIPERFWVGACEVTNEQFRRFDPGHSSRYYQKRHARSDDKGITLDGPQQPAVRVSWQRAMDFCRWLSERTGRRFTLPTEAQWEYACRAGTKTPLGYGGIDDDFSPFANVADRFFTVQSIRNGKQVTGGLTHLVLEGADLADARFADRATVTADVGSYRPNAWGLHDMHGNAAEWTRTVYRPYPYREAPSPQPSPGGRGVRMVVRGGSFFDPPARCRSAFRLDYPAWQRVFNVGFRVVAEGG
jgi:formylglycine-generating enzyme required for sulfatase activity